MTPSLERAIAFATRAHAGQMRKCAAPTPFIGHPLDVMARIADAGIHNPVILCAAVLHDVLEDTPTPAGEIRDAFGEEVTGIVRELSDDKYLLKSLRKQRQVERADLLSVPSRLIRIADKTANIHDIVHAPPAGWRNPRKRDYIAWADRVVNPIRGTHPGLEAAYDEASAAAKAIFLAPAPDPRP